MFDHKVIDIPKWVELLSSFQRQRKKLRKRGVNQVVVFREDTHSSQRVDGCEILWICSDANEKVSILKGNGYITLTIPAIELSRFP